MTTAGAGPWVERWLSEPRFQVYLDLADQDRSRALRLYEWNAMISAAFQHDLAHVEVGLRNAYDRGLSRAVKTGQQHWVFQGSRLFPVHWTTARDGTKIDSNRRAREQLLDAIKQATPAVVPGDPPVAPAPGKVLAELSFGFWRYLTRKLHEKRLWLPYLQHEFPRQTQRADVDWKINYLHKLRNRVAHHETLCGLRLEDNLRSLTRLAQLIDPELERYIVATSSVPRLLGCRPMP